MNRTKEIDVWVNGSEIKKLQPDCTDSFTVYTKDCFSPSIKAKLIIELPERKVEITESMFDEAWEKFRSQGSADFYREEIKKKLFGDQL